MTNFVKSLALAGMAAAAVAATPAAAQVAGIATSSPEAVILRSQARINAYQQIDTQYAAQITQLRTLRQEMQTLQQSLDTDKNGQLSEAEVKAKPSVVTQIQQKEQAMQTATQPIVLAQTYAIEQVVAQYDAARQQVIAAKKIQIMLDPEAIQWAPESVNVTTDIVNALNSKVPSVQITPPAGYRPRQDAYGLQQTIGQALVNLAQQQAAAAAAQQPAAQQPAKPSGR